nr:hypothetical protein Iba_scaffold2753CG0910 [Ipomoea batatas]
MEAERERGGREASIANFCPTATKLTWIQANAYAETWSIIISCSSHISYVRNADDSNLMGYVDGTVSCPSSTLPLSSDEAFSFGIVASNPSYALWIL